MVLDFIQFISDNVNLSASKKQALLVDFCKQYGYEEIVQDENGNPIPNPISRKEFANHRITQYIREVVNAARRQTEVELIVYEELELESI